MTQVPMPEQTAWSTAIGMLNEIHQRMGLTWVYQMKLERIAVDNIATKHIQAYGDARAKEAREIALEECAKLSSEWGDKRSLYGFDAFAAVVRKLKEKA